MNSALSRIVDKLKPEMIWMLAVDGRFHSSQDGPQGYESREAGSVQGVMNGLAVALNDMDKEVSMPLILAIHKASMTGVKSRTPCVPGELRKTTIGSGLTKDWVSLEGIKSLLAEEAKTPALYFTDQAMFGTQFVSISSLPDEIRLSGRFQMSTHVNSNDRVTFDILKKYKNFIQEVKDIRICLLLHRPLLDQHEVLKDILTFNETIKIAKTEQEKMRCILRLAQRFLRDHHPFRDGNTRAFINCLMTRLLIKHTGKIALFYDPNVYEAHSINELIEITQKGFQKADDLLNHPEKSIFGFDNTELDPKYTEMGKEFIKNISKRRFIITHYKPLDWIDSSGDEKSTDSQNSRACDSGIESLSLSLS